MTWSATVSEVLNIFPGCGPVVVVADIYPCEEPPFYECCADPNDAAALCCLADDDTVATQGRIANSGGNHVCGSGAMGWSYGNPTNTGGNLWGGDRYYWFDNLPFGGAYASQKFYLSCNAGTVAIDYTDSANDPIVGVTPAFSGTLCPGPSGTITFGSASFDTTSCAGGNSGTPSIVIG